MIRRLARALAAGLLAGALLAGAGAVAQERGGEPGRFDFYVLALSWSPAFCAGEGGRRASSQCGMGGAPGFVLHGLWPQYERGYPSNCGADRFVPRDALAEAETIFPERGLAIHEWRTHGTCSGLAPSAFFRAAKVARDKVAIPDPLVGLKQDGETDAQTIERAFAAANPGLRSDMMAVDCRRGELQEVRICLTRDLRSFRPCPEVDRAACRFGRIKVRAAR